VVEGGQAQLGAAVTGEALPLLAHVPSLLPEDLGDAGFREAHGVKLAYVVGEMANGITSEALVEAAAQVGALGVFGAAGLPLPRVTQALERLQASLAGQPFGANLIHSPDDQRLEAALVELFLEKGLRFVSASAYLDLTLPVVKYRLAGLHRDDAGRVVVPNRLMAKVSRVEVARKFFEPPPARFVAELVAQGFLTPAQAALAATVPMADDVTAEADSGGHTDNRPLVLLLPALQALRDEVCLAQGYAERPRVGAGGGLATPASVASAFAMGAAYVVTGSINQATREAGTSDAVRALLAQAATTDVAMAPAADMFEMGVKVQVLTRGSLFAVRATRLYELYRTFDSLEALPQPVREELEKKYFHESLEAAWEGVRRFFSERDPAQLERAAKDRKHQLALLFRSYLGQASRWANAGAPERRLDYQVWCGPAMGAFNEWVKGSFLEPWEARHAGLLAKNLMAGAAVHTRLTALRTQGVTVPTAAAHFTPKTEGELTRLTTPRAPIVASATTSTTKKLVSQGEPIAIVGLGSLFPQAENLEAFWRLLRTGRDAVGDVPATHWSLGDYYDADPHAPDKTYAKRGAFLPSTPFDPTEWGIPPSILEATDTAQLLGLVVARMAMEDAGYGEGSGFDRARSSVILGVTGTQELVITLGSRLGHPRWRKALKDAGVDAATADDVVGRISESYVNWQENSFPGLLGNVVAGRIANRLDFGGTNCVVDAACASSLGAVHLAVQELRTGHSDLVLTGGVDCLNDIFMHMCFSKTPALSASGDARPFSDQADGTLLGEGLGMVVLKRLSDAERDGDRVYAVIRSVGSSSDGRAKSIYAPLPKGQARALRMAYELAGVRPRDIALLEAHGTGTKAGDAAEVEALNAVYRADSSDPAWCTLGSVKSQMGHTKAAAGAAGLIKAALALHHKVLPPSLKVDVPNPALKLNESPFTITSVSRPWLKRSDVPRLAAVSSFGFGGSNFHLVLAEHGEHRAAPAWDGSVELVALSAADAPSLVAKARELLSAKATGRALAQARARFKATDGARLSAVLPDGASLEALLAPALERLQKEPGVSFSLPEGVHVGFGAARGKLAFLFPGQGAQHVDMLRDLATVFPELLEAVEADPELARAVYPLATFDAEEKQRRDARLTKTDVAQPAIGAVSRGALELLARFGVKPALLAGHSYGELVALHAGGVLDASALAHVSKLRGLLMAGNDEDRGTMLAVLAPLTQVEALLVDEKLDLVLANRNGPAQGVLSGSRAEIDRAEQACQAKGLRTARLQVGAAFHSPLVAKAASSFREGLASVAFQVGHTPVVANSTALPYPADVEAAKDLLGRQLALPVRFDEVVERLWADGARTFLEVGPKTALTGMVRAILGARAHTALALDAGGRRGGLFDLATLLARVAAEGHPVELSAWQDAPKPPRWVEKPPRVAKMVVPLTGANYRAPYTPRPPRPPQPVRAVVTSVPAHAPAAPPSDAWRAHQQSLAALQTLQEQTARLHQSFLEGQLAAQQSLQSLLSGQPMPLAPVSRTVLSAVSLPPPAPVAPSKPVAAPVLVATPVAVATPIAPTAPAVNVVATMLEVVAEATGYPRETLELSMDLEADLGIDSIKRVEILSLLSRRVPGAPSVNPEKLGSLRTLQQVADFVAQNVPVTAAAPVPVTASVDVKAVLLQVVSELTGYPAETLQLSMDLEADLGIDSIKRVEILSALSRRIPGAPSVNPEKLGALRTLQQVVDFVSPALGTPAPAAPVTKPVASGVDVKAVLLQVVSELTGYPPQTLQLGMDLEADLGIDSIKRVEILSALSRRVPGAPSVNPEKLGSLRTLQQVVDFAGSTQAPVAAVKTTAADLDVAGTLLQVVSELTGYPPQTLQLGMDLEADLGIDSIKRVEILSALSRRVPGAPSVNPEKLGNLRTLQSVVDFIGGAGAVSKPVVTSTPAPTAAAQPEGLSRRVVVPVRAAAGKPFALPTAPIGIFGDDAGLAQALLARLEESGRQGFLIETPTQVPPELGGVLVLTSAKSGWTSETEQTLKAALQLARSVSGLLKDPQAFFVTVSRRDGAFGLSGEPLPDAPLAGGLAGLAKTAAHEWPHVRCRAFDVSHQLADTAAAAAIVEELTNDGPRETGLGPAGRVTLATRAEPVTVGTSRLAAGDVVIVTGGARGVTAECARALAQRTHATLVLLGRSPAPEAEPEWLQAATDEGAIKRALLEHATGEKPTPKVLGERCKQVLAAREIRVSLEALERLGLTALYRSVDVRDEAQVSALFTEVRTSLGPIRGLIHGAGVLRDRRLEDKRDDDFDQVLGPKLGGARALLKAAAQDDLRCIALFASVTGRFGRRGQADYAVANQALVSIARSEAARRRDCRVVAFDWGPWAGGMVTPALKAEFEKEGISLIPLEAGAQLMADELASPPGGPVEVVVGAGFGEEAPATWALHRAYRLDASWPVLADHRLAGKGVLPLAMTLEWFAEAFGGRASLEDVRVLKGVTVGETPEDVAVWVSTAESSEHGVRHQLELRNTQDQVHVRAVAVLEPQVHPVALALPGELRPFVRPIPTTYAEQLFHGPKLHAIESIEGLSEQGMTLHLRTELDSSNLAPAPARAWVTNPLAVDGVFQALILWCRAQKGAPSLPSRLGAWRQFGPFTGASVKAVVRVRETDAATVTSDVDLLDAEGTVLARLEGYVCTVSPSLDRAFGLDAPATTSVNPTA
jgi:PfaD family protein